MTAQRQLAASVHSVPVRHLRLAGTRNLRDVGGYPAGGGRRVRWRTLFRTDSLDRLPVASQRELLSLGVRHVIDLRWPHEIESSPSVFRDSSAVRYESLPLFEEHGAPPTGTPAEVYRLVLDSRGEQLTAIARSITAPGGLPAIIGCAAGVDRTGTTVALLLSAVGVPDDVIAADYAMSAECFAGGGDGSGLDDWRSGPVSVDCLPTYMEEALDHLDRRHGGAAALLERHGFTTGDLDTLTELLTETADPSS